MRWSALVYLSGTLGVYAALGALTPAVASALTPEEKAGARAAAQAGSDAFEAGKYSDAVDYFNRAESLVHAPTHLLYLARAELKLGQLIVARETYLRMIQEDLPAGAPSVFREARSAAVQELQILEPRIPYITLVIQGAGTDEVTVLQDGAPVARALLGIPYPIDPGEHRFEVSAQGMNQVAQKAVVREGSRGSVVLKLAPLVAVGGAAEPDAPAGGNSTAAAGEAPHSNGRQIAGWTALGLGAVGAGIGTVFLVQGVDSASRADAIYAACPLRMGLADCDAPDQASIATYDRQSGDQTLLSAIAFSAGGEAVVTGAVLLLMKSSEHAARPSVHLAGAYVEPWLSPNMAGFRGAF